jgi:voltage-gated potassium channel
VSTAGYLAFGLPFVDALYQTVTTITTVGFREMGDFGDGERLWTIAVAVFGVGTALFTLGTVVESVVEGHLSESVKRRRMTREIDRMKGHVIVCGWGRVGKAVADNVTGHGGQVVVIDIDAERIDDAESLPPTIVGDATQDVTLQAAGIDRARAIVCALQDDADLFVTLSARGLKPDLFIVSRARVASSEAKLLQAGADRVVNPQQLGGARMAAFTSQPHVAEFLDVVMHDGSLEYRLEEVQVPASSPIAGQTLREAQIRDETGALVLAVRSSTGEFTSNPDAATVMGPDCVLIAIGTSDQLAALGRLVDREGHPT